MAVRAPGLGRAAVRRLPDPARACIARSARPTRSIPRCACCSRSRLRALLVHLLVRERDVEDEPRRIPGMRLLAWIVVAGIVGSLLAGFARFASFAAGRVVFTLSLVATLYLLLIVTDAAIERTMSPGFLGWTKACAPARDRSAPPRPVRKARLRHHSRAVRADRDRARDRALGGRGRRSARGDQELLVRHQDRRFHDLVRRGVRRGRAVPDHRRADAPAAALARSRGDAAHRDRTRACACRS